MSLPARVTAGCNDYTGRHPEGGRPTSVETARGLAQKHRLVLTPPPQPPRRLPDHHTSALHKHATPTLGPHLYPATAPNSCAPDFKSTHKNPIEQLSHFFPRNVQAHI